MKFILIILSFVSIQLMAQDLKVFNCSIDEGFTQNEISTGCDFGCAFGWKFDATSTLKPAGDNNYSAGNLANESGLSAWVEGKKGYGVGEKIIITFPQYDSETKMKAPLDGFILINGYAKSPVVWQNNSRVKTFKLYLNGEPKLLIGLLDTMKVQSVGWGRDLIVAMGDKVELEIIDVYKGNKWDDTAVSAIVLTGAH